MDAPLVRSVRNARTDIDLSRPHQEKEARDVRMSAQEFSEGHIAQWDQPLTLDAGYEFPLQQIKWRNSHSTISYLVSKLRAFPTALAFEGRTPFIHHQLYSECDNHQTRDLYHICTALSDTEGKTNAAPVSLVEHNLAKLRSDHSKILSFEDLLTSVQALMMYLIISLFNESAHFRTLGERYIPLLDQWTRNLRDQAPGELPHSLSPWQAWFFAESVRRSILISHLIRGVYATIKQGYHLHTLYVETLPFDVQTSLWEAESASEWAELAPSSRPQMVSYREYATNYATATHAPTGTFERLLLSACYGKERIESGQADQQSADGFF